MTGAERGAIIHVVDDDEDFRVAISRLLRAAGFGVKSYPTAGDFLIARSHESGCILLDMRMPGPSGLDLQQALAERAETLPIIFLSGRSDIPITVKAIKAGAVDFLTKPVQREVLLAAIRSALAGGEKRRVEAKRLQVLRSRYDSLTPRELEVFTRVVAGKPNKEIAHDLGSAERTVKAHRSQVMGKMQADSIAQLVHLADELDAAGALRAPDPTRA
jgi:FixJ family two-component response regulator